VQNLPEGIYEALLDEGLSGVLQRHPELRSIFGKVDSEEVPTRYAAFISKVVEQALQQEHDPDTRIQVCNQIIERLSGRPATGHLAEKKLTPAKEPLLLEITPRHYGHGGMPRPETSLVQSSLFTGSPGDPQLVHELLREMQSADSVDILVSFIKWTGVQLLMAGLEELTARGARLRVITTSYMGASDANAIEWLAGLPNAEVRVSYDTTRTRLHAKAYHFVRKTGFSTGYIGSANISHAAITSGLEWNLKVTAQDMPHILEKFVAEFETYWSSHDFTLFNPDEPYVLRDAIARARSHVAISPVFFDVKPYAFQQRILDALRVEREVHECRRNLVVAATGTGKTVVAAFDFKQFFEQSNRQVRLLFVAHRREILEQAVQTFRGVLRTPAFGELLVGPHNATRLEHLFCSIDMLHSRRLWEQLGSKFYDFIIIDEVHHCPAASYRAVFDQFQPKILLGLTATPERMDGESVAQDFQERFAAEIRLPEALDEKLLCPFHYFGVADPVKLDSDRFWKNGKYVIAELENVYTGAHAMAQQRLETVVTALMRYEPDLTRVRGIGFCVSVPHAEFMAQKFDERGIHSRVLTGDTPPDERERLMQQFRAGDLRFLFTVDVLNEGLDVPEMNVVLFLRPTESLTVFLQQLGRGLRHAPEKDSLTVLDFVGQAHRRYRIDRKLKALLPKTRFSIETEVEMDFPHLPPGCSIHLDRVAREHVLANIRENLRNLSDQVVDRLESFHHEAAQPLTFANFVRFHDYEPSAILGRHSWSEWKAKARLSAQPHDPDLQILSAGLLRASEITGPRELKRLRRILDSLQAGQVDSAVEIAGMTGVAAHYRIWGKPGSALGLSTVKESFEKLVKNPSIIADLDEVLAWAEQETRVGGVQVKTPFECPLELHGSYGSDDVKAALGKANMRTAAERGVGVLHFDSLKTYAFLVTFQKTEREFSPTTMYADYPISRELLHWESQAGRTQESKTGQDLIHHRERGYTILIFARGAKRRDGRAAPFTFLGSATRVRYESERPIKIVWKLEHPMPAEMFEENRRGG
jgi:superfamily II DNA or RNA helicase/HKD family nuclease